MEEYSIPWEKLMKGESRQKLVDDICNYICHCGHQAIMHDEQVFKHPDRMSDTIVFVYCVAHKCKCKMFVRDNLKWLEALANDRTVGV